MDLSTLTDDQLRAEIQRRETEKWAQNRTDKEKKEKAASGLIADKVKQIALIVEEIKVIANDAQMEIELPYGVEDGEFGETRTWSGQQRDWYSSNC